MNFISLMMIGPHSTTLLYRIIYSEHLGRLILYEANV